MASSHVVRGVGGYYGGNQGNLAGVFPPRCRGRRLAAMFLTEPEAYTVFVHPRDPNLRARRHQGRHLSLDRSRRDVQARQFSRQRRAGLVRSVPDPADPTAFTGPEASPASIYRSNDAGASWNAASRPETAGSRQGAVCGPGDAFARTQAGRTKSMPRSRSAA